PTTEEGGGRRHRGLVQREPELVASGAWLAVVGDVRLVRFASPVDIGRTQDLPAVRSELGIRLVAGDPGPLDSHPVAMVDIHEVSPEAVLHATRHRKIRLGIGIGWRDDPPAARHEGGWHRTADRRW